MHNRRVVALLLVLLLRWGLHAQSPGDDPALTVAGDVASELYLSMDDIRGMPRASVEVNEEGTAKKYEGVWLSEILAKAGAPLGESLRGKALASYVLASARDGYQVVFGLAEIDPAFRDQQVLLADSVDGKPLFPYQGPLRLVVSGDKRGARSVRMLARVEVVRLRK
jgi:DMSO/TMAO reductase YedYZ molybdopterin-dependent catalytic subunit